MRLIIIRHSETLSNEQGQMQGYHKNTDFTHKGQDQIKKLVACLKKEPIIAVFCSDLDRSLKTAEAIAQDHQAKLIIEKNLRECDIGIWRNLPTKEALAKWIKYYEEEKQKGIPREDIRPPEGENSFDHQKRVMTVVTSIIERFKEDTVVIVGHSGTNKVIIGSLQHTDPDDFYKVHQSNACINVAEIVHGKAQFVCIDDTTHLA